jgi:hypothetical protein
MLPRLAGYEGVHNTMKDRIEQIRASGASVEGGALMQGVGADDIGICTFVRLASFELVAFENVSLRLLRPLFFPCLRVRVFHPLLCGRVTDCDVCAIPRPPGVAGCVWGFDKKEGI